MCFDADSLVLTGSDSIKIAMPYGEKRVVWGGTAADSVKFKAGVNTSWVCRLVQSTGAADMNITIWYYAQPRGPGGAPWMGVASIISPALGYALAILALGGAMLAKFKRFKRRKKDKMPPDNSITNA